MNVDTQSAAIRLLRYPKARIGYRYYLVSEVDMLFLSLYGRVYRMKSLLQVNFHRLITAYRSLKK